MLNVPIQMLTNQTFTIILDNNNWTITIKFTNGVMAVSLTLNGNDVIDNLIAVAGSFIIPSEYEESGNFIFTTMNQQLPDWTQFGTSQNLIYVSQNELDLFRTPTPPPITAADFNPIVQLPLRFSPQGYT